MIVAQFARIIADFVVFIRINDEKIVDPDAAASFLDLLIPDLHALDEQVLRELIDAFTGISAQFDGDPQAIIRDTPRHLRLGEALAARRKAGSETGESGERATLVRQLARIMARIVIFLDLTDDDQLDPDDAVEYMEGLAGEFEIMDKAFLRDLVDTFPSVALEFDGEEQTVVRDIADSFYLEEELAADDPVRLAELEALRDARD